MQQEGHQAKTPEVGDTRFSDDDREILDKFIAEQRLKAGITPEEAQAEAQDPEETKVKKSDLEQAYESLELKHKDFVEKIRQQLIAKLPKKLQEQYKDRPYESLELLVEYLTEGKKAAGIPRTPELKDIKTATKKTGSIGGYNTKTKKWK